MNALAMTRGGICFTCEMLSGAFGGVPLPLERPSEPRAASIIITPHRSLQRTSHKALPVSRTGSDVDSQL